MSDLQIAHTVAEVRAWRRSVGGSVGLVPTMGYLHQGHLELVRQAASGCDRVAASIFVNPAQFDRVDDLDHYPRDLERDLELLRDAGVALAFVPEPGELYPPGFDTWVEPGRVADEQEGRHRPGHFRGVATVVLKLLNLVQPQRAYFGRKDAQQLAVIQSLVRDLDVDCEVVPVDTVREPGGLAMSSRNARLSPDERTAALVIYQALTHARQAWEGGIRDAEQLRQRVRETLAQEPLAELEYVSLADPQTMAELENHCRQSALLSLAAQVGPVRLIDNLLLEASFPDSTLLDDPSSRNKPGL